MSILYDFKRLNDNLNEEEGKTKGYYPRVISRGTLDTKKMLHDLADGSPFLEAELLKSLNLIQEYVLRSLKEGYNVCLTDFGTFSLSAESRLVQTVNEIRAESIRVKGMNFRTAPSFNRKLRCATFEKR